MGEWSVRVELAFSHISTAHTQTVLPPTLSDHECSAPRHEATRAWALAVSVLTLRSDRRLCE